VSVVDVPLAEYLVEARSSGSWPDVGPLEIAFAGRSNVGKSSLINTLTARKALARTSNTPGRTKGLIFFRVQPQGRPELRFVDLPGYGYARVSQQERHAWKTLVEGYVTERGTLAAVVVVIDARRGVKDEDCDLVEWLLAVGRRPCVVLTKLDKLARNERKLTLDAARAAFAKAGLALPKPPIGFSSRTREGRDALWARLLEGPA